MKTPVKTLATLLLALGAGACGPTDRCGPEAIEEFPEPPEDQVSSAFVNAMILAELANSARQDIAPEVTRARCERIEGEQP